MADTRQAQEGDQNFEKRYPYVYSVIVTLLSTIICSVFGNSPKLSNEILSAGITVASIIIGFNAVYRNTLQTKASKTIRDISNTSYMELYHGYLKAVTNSSIRFIMLSFIILFIPKHLWNHIIIFNLWLLFAANMLLCFYRANSLDSLLFESK